MSAAASHPTRRGTLPQYAFATTSISALVAALVLDVATAQDIGAQRELPAEMTAASVVDPSWQAPQTSWGHPNLEGVWTTDDMRSVPRERPEQFSSRQQLTDEEFDERAGTDTDRRNRALNEETFSARNEWGIRTFGYTSQIIDPPNGRTPPMTEAGLARAASRDRGTFGQGPFNDVDDFTLYDRCMTRGILGGKFPVVYGNGLKITQNPNTVAISYEMIHDTRIVRLDDRGFIEDNMRQYLGDSLGRWDGNTLVVETRNLTDQTSIGANGNGTRHSEAMVITERFTRVDPEMIEYVATVDDPVAYTAPFTVRLMLTSQPNYRIWEYNCHEGNQAVRNALSGERTYERDVAEALARGEEPPDRVEFALGGLPEEEEAFFDINAGE
jgi:hypothetical protein